MDNYLLNSNKTAVIVLNWNKPEITLDCIKSLNTMEGDYDIFVIDNGSDEAKRDKLVDEMKKQNAVILKEDELAHFEINSYKAVNIGNNNSDNKLTKSKLNLLILLNKNYGYGKGNNFGLRLACKLGYKYSLISNNDIKIIDVDVLTELIKGMETDEKIAWASPKIINIEGYQEGLLPEFDFFNFSFLSGGIFYPFYILFLKKREKIKSTKLLDKYDKGEIVPKWFMGSFVFLKNEAVERIGFFDENIFLYAEELILSEKLKIKGFVLKYIPNVKILHEHNYTAEKINFKREYQGIKSLLYYYKVYKNYNSFIILNAAKISRLFYIVIYKPVIQKTKTMLKRLNINYKGA